MSESYNIINASWVGQDVSVTIDANGKDRAFNVPLWKVKKFITVPKDEQGQRMFKPVQLIGLKASIDSSGYLCPAQADGNEARPLPDDNYQEKNLDATRDSDSEIPM